MRSSFPLGKTLFFFLAVIPLLACSIGRGFSAEPKALLAVAASNSAPEPPKPSLEDQILVAVSKALRRAKLLNRPDQCYAYAIDRAPGQSAYTVDVMENHQHPECGGDPLTQPHLFTVHVEKTTRALSSDARTPSTFLPLKP